MMPRVVLACALLLACTWSTAHAVSCGDILTDVPLSGCLECTEVNMTRDGHHFGYGRNLLHGSWGSEHDGPDHEGFNPGAALPIPSCTKCDTDNNFVLMTRNGSSPIGRCGCNDTYGVVITGNATVTVGNYTRTVPQFNCAPCGNNEVPLGPNSGLTFAQGTDGTWQLVLRNSSTTASSTTTDTTTGATSTGPTKKKKKKNRRKRTRSAGPGTTAGTASTGASTPGLSNLAVSVSLRAAATTVDVTASPGAVTPPTGSETGPITTASHHGGPDGFGPAPGGGGFDGPHGDGDGDFGGRHGGGDGFGRRLPAGYIPGQCVPCPDGSTTTDKVTCVAL